MFPSSSIFTPPQAELGKRENIQIKVNPLFLVRSAEGVPLFPEDRFYATASGWHESSPSDWRWKEDLVASVIKYLLETWKSIALATSFVNVLYFLYIAQWFPIRASLGEMKWMNEDEAEWRGLENYLGFGVSRYFIWSLSSASRILKTPEMRKSSALAFIHIRHFLDVTKRFQGELLGGGEPDDGGWGHSKTNTSSCNSHFAQIGSLPFSAGALNPPKN